MKSVVSPRGAVVWRGDFSSGHFVLKVEGQVGSLKHEQRAHEKGQSYR